jgi:hypothetical protein
MLLIIKMRHHLGPAAFDYAERLQETNKYQIAMEIIKLDGTIITSTKVSLANALPVPPDYSKITCYIPSKNYIAKQSYKQAIDRTPQRFYDPKGRTYGHMVFSHLWAYFLVHGECMNSASFANALINLRNDVKCESDFFDSGKKVFDFHLQTPTTTRQNLWDHDAIDEVEEGLMTLPSHAPFI